jgi:glycosyltransferase involved in cell wall biosynthesis
VHCDVVGDGPDRDALHARAERLGLAHRITWHGALPTQALPALYRRAAMTVMPSREEGLGLVAVESQLCATPVIAYNSGGLPDVVSPTAGGTLVPVGDIGALRIAIDRLTRVPTDAQSSGERARTHMLEVFSPQRVAAEYLRLYANAEAGARG